MLPAVQGGNLSHQEMPRHPRSPCAKGRHGWRRRCTGHCMRKYGTQTCCGVCLQHQMDIDRGGEIQDLPEALNSGEQSERWGEARYLTKWAYQQQSKDQSPLRKKAMMLTKSQTHTVPNTKSFIFRPPYPALLQVRFSDPLQKARNRIFSRNRMKEVQHYYPKILPGSRNPAVKKEQNNYCILIQ